MINIKALIKTLAVIMGCLLAPALFYGILYFAVVSPSFRLFLNNIFWWTIFLSGVLCLAIKVKETYEAFKDE